MLLGTFKPEDSRLVKETTLPYLLDNTFKDSGFKQKTSQFEMNLNGYFHSASSSLVLILAAVCRAHSKHPSAPLYS